MSEGNQKTDVKDGFDLIDFPCDYAFKAMCKVTDNVDLPASLTELMLTMISEDELLEVRSASSRTGKFESVTLKVKVLDRNQLELIYQTIANSPLVVMTL